MPATRDVFLLDPGVVFLNHASFGACPREVLEAQQRWQYEMERNPVAFLARRSADLLGHARRRLAEAVGARPDDLVFVTNATTAVNAVARSVALGAGDEVVTTDLEYGACDLTWERRCRAADARLIRVPVDLPLQPERVVRDLVAALTPRTRLVTLSHVTSSTALILPVAAVCREVSARAVPVLVDGAHAPGQVPLELDALGADFYSGNCHKWMCAPKGAAFLWVRPSHWEAIEPPVVSWGLVDEAHPTFTGTSPLERRLQWQGTRDLSAFLAVPTALDVLGRLRWADDRARCHALAVETAERIAQITGLAPIAGAGDTPLMSAAPLPADAPDELESVLRERYRIEVPVTRHGERRFVRASFHLYSTREDADALVAALAEVLA